MGGGGAFKTEKKTAAKSLEIQTPPSFHRRRVLAEQKFYGVRELLHAPGAYSYRGSSRYRNSGGSSSTRARRVRFGDERKGMHHTRVDRYLIFVLAGVFLPLSTQFKFTLEFRTAILLRGKSLPAKEKSVLFPFRDLLRGPSPSFPLVLSRSLSFPSRGAPPTPVKKNASLCGAQKSRALAGNPGRFYR